MNLSGRWIDQIPTRKPLKELILDMDSSANATYGDQEGTAYNGHFEYTCYHPLFLFSQFGDVEWAMLWPELFPVWIVNSFRINGERPWLSSE
jgi:hypothetical protein